MLVPVVDGIVADKLTFFLMENGELASNLIRKAIKARDAREAARKARDESRNGKKKKRQGLVVWEINSSPVQESC